MTEISLTIHGDDGTRDFAFAGERLLIGCAGADSTHNSGGTLLIDDDALARRHASINREGQSLWVLDEGSPEGIYVNGRSVPPQGLPLTDGDEIFLSRQTTLILRLHANAQTYAPTGARAEGVERASSASPLSLALAVFIPLLCLVGVALLFSRYSDARNANNNSSPASHISAPTDDLSSVADSGTPDTASETQTGDGQPAPADGGTSDIPALSTSVGADDAGAPRQGAKLYLQMSREEQLQFLEQRAQHISMLMGNRPYAFNDEVLGYIKQYVDVYARRVGNNSSRMWGEDLRFVFARARTQYAPHIIRAFNARNVPPVVGLYIVMIETEYHNIRSENFAGAAGLFQFIGPTASLYGVHPSERTNVEKMAPAAARYMADRIAEFGTDSMSVALAIAGYNRSADSVRRDLRDVLNDRNKERSFWTLVANSNQLDHWFQNENIKYVPKFFAAAIVGENPEAFGLEMRKLSTYTVPQNPANGERPASERAEETAR